ncbi:MAG: Hpt domain-containing protein, partial [Gammaproteobacteria bacterium]|nr:Hpt domain-containing protein [Gammaproteobacteria bacterium]
MRELASQSLDLVNRELSNTLETARGEIEDFVDGQSDSEALVRAASMLHLAAGALKIVEIHGAALLAEEMEQTCRAIHESGSRDSDDQGIEALTRAMVQLPAYLERLMSGGSDVALVLLPLLNDLRTARGQPMLSEGTLLLLNTGPFERLRGVDAADPRQSYGTDVPALAQRLRPAFQAALLGWIRGDDAAKNLDELIKASDTLEDAAESEPVRQLWAVTAGVLVALKNGDIEPSVQIKRLLGQADRQLKRLIDKGEQAFVSAPPVELLNSMLYYVARASGNDPRIAELKQAFGVEAAIPDADEIEQAREDLAGPSTRLMRTVAEAIREDLGDVKDVLDIFVRTGMDNMAELRPQLEMLKKIGDTLGVLGLETARDRIQGETSRLADIVASQSVDDPAVLENIAASLLDVEDMLERELVTAGARESEAVADDERDQALETNQFRHVTQAVMRECIVNLAKIKEAVVRVLDEPDGLRALDQVQPQLRGIVAGLLMLNKNKAVNVIERIGRNVTTRLSAGSKALKPSLIERLADAIVSIEYYMETVALGRADPDYMLDNANRCLDVLEEATADDGASRTSPAPEPEPEAAAGPDETAAEEKPSKLSVMEVDEDRSEPELVEIFIEEAKEELDNIREQLPRWIDQPQDTDALIAVRRSFHTLKGSGRV